MRTKRTSGRLNALGLLVIFLSITGAGCVGYLTGSYDIEMQRLRTIIAELEAKNSALAEECIGLRERMRKLEPAGQDRSGIVDRTRSQDLLGSDAGPGVSD